MARIRPTGRRFLPPLEPEAPAQNDSAAAIRVAVAEALPEYSAEQIRAMVEAELRAQALDTPLAHG